MSILAGLASTLSGVSAAGAPIPGASPQNVRNEITVAPVGFNLGSILQPYTDNPANGGAGLVLPSPVFSGVSASAPKPYEASVVPGRSILTGGSGSGGMDPLMLGGIAIAVIAGLYALTR